MTDQFTGRSRRILLWIGLLTAAAFYVYTAVCAGPATQATVLQLRAEDAPFAALTFQTEDTVIPGAGLSPDADDGVWTAVKEAAADRLAKEEQKLRELLAGDAEAYHIMVNRAQNTVTVYEKDEGGAYTVPVRAMVCSTGQKTPLGEYYTSKKYEWRPLFGNVYGQYATRIVGHILFHSVPYTETRKDALEYEEYNKLGTSVSMGCIRLSVEDAKWLYDYCASGTRVTIYEDADPGPLGKPEPMTIDVDNPNRGWDPTDPDPANPWMEEAAEEKGSAAG